MFQRCPVMQPIKNLTQILLLLSLHQKQRHHLSPSYVRMQSMPSVWLQSEREQALKQLKEAEGKNKALKVCQELPFLNYLRYFPQNLCFKNETCHSIRRTRFFPRSLTPKILLCSRCGVDGASIWWLPHLKNYPLMYRTNLHVLQTVIRLLWKRWVSATWNWLASF